MPHNQPGSRVGSVIKYSRPPTKESHQQKQPNNKPDSDSNLFIPPRDPSEPPDYDYSKDRGRRLKLRAEEQCVFNHARAENSPLLDVKQWREKLRILRALPKPNEKEAVIKRPRHRPHKGKKPKDKRSDAGNERSLKISANIPSTGIDLPQLGDPDMMTFGDILDPKMSAGTRYDKYLEELGRDDGVDKADLESLYKENFRHLENKPNQILLVKRVQNNGITEDKKQNINTANDDDDINVAELVAKASTKRHAPVRSFSTEPVIEVSGNHRTLHDKPAVESRLSLNNFKLRLNLSDETNKAQNIKTAPEDPTRKHQTVIDSARSASEDAKLMKYVAKTSFSPRRISFQNDNKVDHLALRRESLHLPASTTKNLKCKTPLPLATKTAGSEAKGGGWKVAHSKREINFNKMIPVSITGEAIERNIPSVSSKYKS